MRSGVWGSESPRDKALSPEVRLRPQSLLPLVLTASLLLLQLFFPSRTWTVLLCGVGGMTAVAYLWARSLARTVRVTRSLRYAWVQVGDLLEEEFILENRGRWPVLWAEVEDRSTLPGYAPGQVVAAGGGETFRWRERTICRRRGVYRLGPCSVRTRDPFGLFGVTLRYDEERTLLVVPSVRALPAVALPRGIAAGRAAARQSGPEVTLNASGARPFAPGDPLRRIHWPSSARHQALIAKTFDAEVSGAFWIVLDLDGRVQAGEEDDSTEEYGVVLAASLADQMLRQNRAVGLVASGRQPVHIVPRPGEGQLWEILHALASVQAGGTSSLAAVLTQMRPLFGQRSTLAVITPSADPSWVAALWAFLRLGIAPIALLLDAVSFGGTGDLSPVRDVLAGLAVPVQTLSLGLPFFLPTVHKVGSWEFKTTPTGKVVVTQRPREAA